MRLLFVGTSRSGRGAESHMVHLARAMKDAGHQVTAVICLGSPIDRWLEGSGIDRVHGYFRNSVDPRGLLAVLRSCRRFHPHWIIGEFSKEFWPLLLIARLQGISLVLFKHVSTPMKPLTRSLLPRLTDRFVAVSQAMRRMYVASGVPPQCIEVLHNPLDVTHFAPDDALRRRMRGDLAIRDEDIVVGFVGSLDPGKGPFVLFQALREAVRALPTLKALWIGSGASENDLRARVSADEARHRIIGWTPDVKPYYVAMDLLAVPSICEDSFSRVSIEAQACGVPVLGSHRGGIPETLIPGESGTLVGAGDVEAWKNAILELALDTDRRRRMGSAAREMVVRRFSTRVIAARFEELLRRN